MELWLVRRGSDQPQLRDHSLALLPLLAPSFLIGGILLWRQVPWGAVIAAAVNVFGAVYLTVRAVVGGFQADAGIAGKTWLSPVALGSIALCLAATAVLLVPGRPSTGGTATRTTSQPA